MTKNLKTTPVLDSSDIINLAHERFQLSGEKSGDAASRLLSIVDDTSGPDVGALVALMALGLADLIVGRVRNGKLRIRGTDQLARQLGGRFEVEVHWSEVKIAFTHFYFPDHWDAGKTLV